MAPLHALDTLIRRLGENDAYRLSREVVSAFWFDVQPHSTWAHGVSWNPTGAGRQGIPSVTRSFDDAMILAQHVFGAPAYTVSAEVPGEYVKVTFHVGHEAFDGFHFSPAVAACRAMLKYQRERLARNQPEARS